MNQAIRCLNEELDSVAKSISEQEPAVRISDLEYLKELRTAIAILKASDTFS